MRILCVNSVISEFGGIEYAAMNLARGLARRGHELHFLGAQGQRTKIGPALKDTIIDELDRDSNVWFHQRRFYRPYRLDQRGNLLTKAIWHLRDLAAPANEWIFYQVLQDVRPDVIILHNLTAVGKNIWRPIKKSRIPCLQWIYDLGLICLNSARFRSGRQCSGLCVACRMQTSFRLSLISKATNFAFVAPSYATLRDTEKYADLSAWRREVIPYPNAYVVKPKIWNTAAEPRLLYVGRLDPSKGVEMMLRAAERAQTKRKFHIDILGAGSLDELLRRTYSGSPWITFHGSVNQESIAEFMSLAIVLLVPSVWRETFGIVVAHAMFAGLPVLGSRIGGIVELISDGQTGRLLPPGDEEEWSVAIVEVLDNIEQTIAWSEECLKAARRLDPELLLDACEKLLQEMIVSNGTGVRNE